MGSQHSTVLAGEAATLAFGRRLARASFRDPDQDTDQRHPGTRQDGAQPNQTGHPDGCFGYPSLGGVIYLHGDLGAGKTTLARGLLRGYGFSGAVKSPTYTLVEPYVFVLCTIYHFDLYRVNDAAEVAWLGVEDCFAEPNLCLVEWAEKGLDLIPAADLSIHLDGTGPARELHCQSRSGKGRLIAQRLWDEDRDPKHRAANKHNR